MADIAELEAALVKADAAGNAEDAKAFADEIRRLRFAETAGGAAVGNPQIQAQGERSLREGSLGTNLSAIGGAGAIGGALGVAAPEILSAAGRAAGAFPATAPAAPFFDLAAGATRAAGRAATGVAGALSGMTGEAAGQTAEAFGAGPVVAEGARFVGGAISPELARFGKWALTKVIQAPALSTERKLAKEFAKAVMAKLEGRPQDLSAEERQYLDGLIADLRGAAGKTDAPMQDVYGALQAGARNARTLSTQEASQIFAEADRDASRILQETMRGPVARMRGRSQELDSLGRHVLTTAQGQRLNIGAERELSDIGGDLRNVIVRRNEAAIKAREAAYKATERDRDNIVKAKEDAGEFIESRPEFKSLVEELRQKLLIGQKAQQQTTAPVTEPGVLKNYQTIYEAVRNRRVQTGTNEEGNPVYKTFPTSFHALDDVRRRLGDVLKGQPGEGYEAIGEAIARKYYAQISDIQKRFVDGDTPGIQTKLLDDYAKSSEALKMYRGRAGKRATAVDRYDDEEYITDASALPARFFKSAQGVQDLVELTGDRPLVSKAASDYATRQLEGKSAEQVRAWLRQNSDWLRQMPEVWSKVGNYSMTLERGERIARNAERGSQMIAKREADAIRTGERMYAERRAAGASDAAAVRATGERTAQTLLGDRFPVERVRQLIESGSVEQWATAGPAIAKDPQAQGAVADAVRQVIADRAQRGTKGIVDFFARNVRPAVESAGLLSAKQADDIASQLAQIERLQVPQAQKLGWQRRIILQGVSGLGASLGSRGVTSLVDLIPQ